MTPDDRRTLLNCLSEYEKSLSLMADERAHMKAITARVFDELNIPEKHFVALAKAQYAGKASSVRDDLGNQVDFFDLVLEPANRHERVELGDLSRK